MILCYSIENRQSFEKIEEYLKEAKEINATSFKILVGLKSDLESERVVSFEEAKKASFSNCLLYFEVSSKENKGVHQMFDFCYKCFWKISKIKENLGIFEEITQTQQNQVKQTSFCSLN